MNRRAIYLALIRRVLLAATLLCTCSWGHGAEIIVGSHQLLANTAQQHVDIEVIGGDAVSGIDLFVQVGDGGPQLAEFGLPQGRRGPSITGVELIEDTIFQDVTDPPFSLGSSQLNQTAVYSLALVGDKTSVPANGRLVRLTVDSSDLYHGTWDLLLSDVLPFPLFGGPHDTNFAGLPALIRNGTLTIAVSIGDFSGNQLIDVADLDLLAEAIRSGSEDLAFDLDEDGMLTTADHEFWVKRIARTHVGDSNFDGEFNSTDLVVVFAAGEYEDNIALNSSWASGDWNGSGDFDSSDLVAAFSDGGYDQGPVPAVSAVPEPSTFLLAMTALIAALTRSSRGRHGSFSRRRYMPPKTELLQCVGPSDEL